MTITWVLTKIFYMTKSKMALHSRSKRKKSKVVATLQPKAKTWDKAGKSGADSKFRWECHDGRMITLCGMSTHHVWNALKLAWEKRHANSPLGKCYWKQAIANLYLELASRPNITNDMKATMKVIAKRITKR